MLDRTALRLGLIFFWTFVFLTTGGAWDAGDPNAVAVEELNSAPVADAGPDATTECTGSFMTQWKTAVMLDGTGSTDPDGDPLTYEWVAPGIVFDDPSSPTPTGRFPLGTTTVTLTVSDGVEDDQDTVDVTVMDTTPPSLVIALNRDVLWPPNHMMADIFVLVAVTRDCCPTSPTVVLTSVTSNEPDNGVGDGDTVDDIQDADIGTEDNAFRLRSERSGIGDGRVYTIVYTATDCAGNSTSQAMCVHVPHDMSQGTAMPSTGFTESGTALDPAAREFALIIPSTPTKYYGNKKDRVRDGFDATALDVERIYVGNIKTVVTPVRTKVIDQNHDGLGDLAVFYSSKDISVLLRDGVAEEGGSGVENKYGSIDLQYTSANGEFFLVSNIFSLGKPVSLESSDGWGNTGGGGDPSGPCGNETPTVTTLLPNYPNPFNPSTTIPFTLAGDSRVTLHVYDARGKLVRTLEDRTLPAGRHRVVWDGRDNGGRFTATGVYFVRLVAGKVQSARKIVLIQ